jgi:hypothetical protein
MLPEPIAVTLRVIDVLESMSVPYLISGSLASSIYGPYRITADSDVVADLKVDQIDPFARALGGEFHLDAESMRDAVGLGRSFSLIHQASMFKVNVFISKQRPYDRVQLVRRVKQVVWPDPQRTAYIASAEDAILAKLEWYRLGGEDSERQWRDVQEMLKAQSGRLDLAYMNQWATDLKVDDLLDSALAESA